MLLEELDKISRNIKRKKAEVQSKEIGERKKSRMAERRLLRGSTAERNDHPSVELPGNVISSGNWCSHRQGERK